MTSHLIHRATDNPSVARLKQIYDTGLIPAEKKPFLIDLKRSVGPYLAIADSDEFILDGCSQIATLGLGFNASPLFAPSHHIESWTGDFRSKNIRAFADAYRNLLQRLLGLDNYKVHFSSSGAEAVEIALGLCFDNRANKLARRVLAFEGSFHGRMMVALASTSNPKKRAPFAWPGHESEFVPYPYVHGNPNIKKDEQSTLNAIDEKLATGDFFAVLMEPMQCEGGDRHSSSEFHRGLNRIVRRHGVALVYDEVQTGFHLGSQFFWHRQFDLTDENGSRIGPDAICCAKKSQVGVVLTKFDIPYQETFCPASLVRGYAGAFVLDQFSESISEIEKYNRQRLNELTEKHSDLICNPRAQGFAFAFDFPDADSVGKFVGRRFPHGLLFYPAGQRTARFRVNLACSQDDLDQLWTQIEDCLTDQTLTKPKQVMANREKVSADYRFHSDLVAKQLNHKNGSDENAVVNYLNNHLSASGIENTVVRIVDKENYVEYRDQILAMQKQVYEPIRQTPAEEFDALFSDTAAIGPISIVVTQSDQIISMAFCGRLALFQNERGVSDDPHLNDDTVYYMVDLTVAEPFRGGLGRCMKNAIALLAVSKGVTAIHGRNRDRLARGMWAINLSLGSFESKHLADDYQDEREHRDCIYYRMPLRFESNVSENLPFNTIELGDLTPHFVNRNLPALVNKVCLSNFVSEEFLEDLQCVAGLMPKELQHVYTASSLSECVDKITKAIWLKRNPVNHLLTVDGHFFGEGSFLARSLSGTGEPMFGVTRLNHSDITERLKSAIKENPPIAFFVQAEKFAGHEDELARCVAICREYEVPVVFNETGLRFGTKDQMSRIANCQPDASIVWLGGQMALAFVTVDYFADDPLLLISTWDGDAYSLARFAHFVRKQSD